MNILVLDCAYKPTIAILNENKEILIKQTENENHSDNFMLLLDKSLKEINLSISDIDEFMINIGPGSFTGLRVAVSIAKGLGFGDDKKFLTFTSFDYISDCKEILLSGFSNFVYRRDVKGQMYCENISSLDSKVDYQTPNHELYEKLRGLGFNVIYQERCNYFEIYKKLEKKYVLIYELEPLYLRKSQAEMEREKKEGK